MKNKCIARNRSKVSCKNTQCYGEFCGIHKKLYSVNTIMIYNPVGLNLLELLTFNKYLRTKYEINKSYDLFKMGEIVNFLKEDPSIFNIFKKMNNYEQKKTTKLSSNTFEYKFDT